MLSRITIVLLAACALAASPGSLSFAQEFYYDLDTTYTVVPSDLRIAVQFDTTRQVPASFDFVTAHPCLSGEVEYLDRGFWVYGLQPSSGYAASAADLRSDAAVHRVLPVYRWAMDSAEFEVSDLVDVQFDDSLPESAALALLASHGLRFIHANEYRHNLWECALNDTITSSPLEYGNAMHVLPGVKWACARQYGTGTLACVVDPYYQHQYYLKNTGQNLGTKGIDINAEPAWEMPLANPSLLVAVFDDGVVPHEDLPAARIVPGWDFVDNDNSPAPDSQQNHGMACAGIIAASHNNIGIAGVCGTCRILPVRVFNKYNEPVKSETMAKAFYFASQQGARVISCSWTWGSVGPVEVIANAIRYVTDKCDSGGLGAVVVFASDNYARDEVFFPANMPEVIAVGAVKNTGAKWAYSNYGSALDVVAPSGDVGRHGDQWTIDGTDTLGWNPKKTGAWDASSNWDYTSVMGGTSGACPQVAGIAALMLACENIGISDCNPGPEILWAITNTATDLPPHGWDSATGFGLANAYQAMLSIYNPPFPPCNCPNQGNVDTLNSPCVVDVFDVSQMIAIAFSGGLDITDSWCPTTRGDVDRVNSPGVVDVMDVIQIIAIAFSSGFADNPCAP